MILYLDCGMGAAGDMLTAALLELFEDRAAVVEELNGLGIPHVEFRAEPMEKCGLWGTHMQVLVHGQEGEHHHHAGMADIGRILDHLNAPEPVRRDAKAVYNLIARAESAVHGVTVEQVHFHEVGALDAVADVAAVCYLLNKLKPERILASPVHVGSGKVCCAHGILPVPAPATALLLQGVPVYGGSISGELCTPTGAALLKYFVTEFGNMPVMTVEQWGYGMGKKDFPAANCLRAALGREAGHTDRIFELSCNLDDMTPEHIGFAMERLLEAGALDVYTQPIGMKKCRPGTMLTVLCHQEQRERLVQVLFANTTTLGIRESEHRRYILHRESETVETPYGPVEIKTASGYGVERSKPEYEDLARLARQTGKPLSEIAKSCKKYPPRSEKPL